jgi:hypothetical protein
VQVSSDSAQGIPGGTARKVLASGSAHGTLPITPFPAMALPPSRSFAQTNPGAKSGVH